jgi:hypothetical protein
MTMKRALRQILIATAALACLPGCFGAINSSQTKREKEKQIAETKQRRDIAANLNSRDDAPLIGVGGSIDREIANLERRARDEERRLVETRRSMNEARELYFEQEMRVSEINNDLAHYRRVRENLSRGGSRGGGVDDTTRWAPTAANHTISSDFDEAAFFRAFPDAATPSRQPPSTSGSAWMPADTSRSFTPEPDLAPRPLPAGSWGHTGVRPPTSMVPPSNTWSP